MEILNAALAFAVLMITLSTAATALSESVLRLYSQRCRVLKRAIEQLLKNDPRLQQALADVAATSGEDEEARKISTDLRTIEGCGEAAVKALATLRQEYGGLSAAVTAYEDLTANSTTARRLKTLLDTARSETTDQENAVEKKLEEYGSIENAKKKLQKSVGEKANTPREKTQENLLKNPAFTPLRIPFTKKELSFLGSRTVDTLTTYAFVQRLAETEVGKALYPRLEKGALKAVTRSFERYVSASNELFRKRARLLTILAAIVLAFAINVPAGPVFDYLIKNPELADELADQGEDAQKQYITQLNDFNETMTRLQVQIGEVPALPEDTGNQIEPSGNAGAEGGDTGQPSATTGAQPVDPEANDNQTEERSNTGTAGGGTSQPSAETDEQPVDPEELQDTLDQVNETIGDIASTLGDARSSFDLPLGYETTWFQETCGGNPEGSSDSHFLTNLANKALQCAGSEDWYHWALNVLLSGLLIGLGGPFWYRVFTSLSYTAQLVRTFRGSPHPETVGAGNNESQPVHASLTNDGEDGKAPSEDIDQQLEKLFLSAVA